MTAKGAPQKKINVADVAGAATYNYGELISGSSTALKPFADVDDATGQVEIEPHSAISYAACVADVEVDDETGEVVVLKMVQVYDVGRAINPTLVEGQIEGGAIMGLGLGSAREQLSGLSVGRQPRRRVRRVSRPGPAGSAASSTT